MSEIKIKAEPRTEFGKGAARRIRRSDMVPAVLYEHGNDPQHLSLPGHALMMALKNSNALMSVQVSASKSHLAIPKQVQRDPIKGFIEHVDLLMVRRGEKVVVDIPLAVDGEVVRGSLVVTEHNEVPIEAEATNIPEHIEVSVEGMDAGDQVLASDLNLPDGSVLQIEDDTLILHVVAERTVEEVEAELAEAEAEAGIEHDEREVEEVGERAGSGSVSEATGSE